MGKINNNTMRENNIRLVLNTIRKAGLISRAELAKQLNLTSPAVTNIVGNLISRGMVRESGCTESAHGRKPISVRINPEACRVLGMVISTDGVSVALGDFSGSLLTTCSRPLELMGDNILDTVIACARDCIRQSGVKQDTILSIGLAAPGPMDVQRGILLDPPNFPGLRNVPVCRILEEAFGIPVVLDKEANAAGLAEYYLSSSREVRTVFSVYLLAHSIGGGLLRDGEIVHGFADGVGDIGHMMVDSNGPLCSCGQYGCLETVATGDAVLAQLVSRLKLAGIRQLPGVDDVDRLTLEDVVRLNREGNPLFRQARDRAVHMLAVALGNVISIISPEMIQIGGPVVDLCPELVGEIRQAIHSRSYPPCCGQIRVERSQLGSTSFLSGAVMLALTTHQTLLCRELP